MGNLGNKMARWKMVNALGPELAAKILAAAKPPLDESHVILKDGLIGESEKVFAEDGVPELKDSVPSSTWSPGFSADALIAEFETLRSTISNDAWGSKWADGIEQGSNCWVVDGRWTASGAPLGGGDPHRQADFPNVYYQNRALVA